MELAHTRFYQVAEHIFEVQSNDNALLESMTNYQPFDITSSHTIQEETIFRLSIVQKGLLHQERKGCYTHLCTDQSEQDMPRIEVYHTHDHEGWLICVSTIADSPICCELESNHDFTQAQLHIALDYKDIRFCIDNALMLMYAFRTAPLMTLEMHASVAVKEELGHLFLGHSGTGKSTHARQWLQAFPDAWLLNDDNPILRVMNDGEVRVYGSPWSGKTPCYKNDYARVGSIVKLSQAPHNKIRAISLPEAYAAMLSSASGLKMDQQIADHMHESIKHIIMNVRCFHMECLPNTEAAVECFQGVRKG